jgi:hypothetical protein
LFNHCVLYSLQLISFSIPSALVYRLGKTIAAKVDIGTEKHDICNLIQMVTGVGLELAAVEGAKK